MSTTRSTCGRLAPGMDLGCRGSGRRAWPRRPEFDQVGVWIEEVGADVLRRVHVPGLLLPPILLVAVLQRYLIRGLLAGALRD